MNLLIIIKLLKITNTTTAPINVRLKCLSITNATGPNMETCFGPDCYIIAVNQVLPTTGSGYVTINNGTTDTSAKFHNNDQGAGVFPIDYVFKIYQINIFRYFRTLIKIINVQKKI